MVPAMLVFVSQDVVTSCRNCRERLSQHNRRRRKSKWASISAASDGSWGDTPTPEVKVPRGPRSKRPSQVGTGCAFDLKIHGIILCTAAVVAAAELIVCPMDRDRIGLGYLVASGMLQMAKLGEFLVQWM